MKVQERSSDVQSVNSIVLFNIILDPIKNCKNSLNHFKAVSTVLYHEIMTSTLVFYFDRVISLISEDFENSAQLTWTTAFKHLRSVFEA